MNRYFVGEIIFLGRNWGHIRSGRAVISFRRKYTLDPFRRLAVGDRVCFLRERGEAVGVRRAAQELRV